MTLKQLLAKCGVTMRDAAMWFSSSELVGSQLRVSDIDDFGCISRCWLETLRGAMPDLDVVFLPASQRGGVGE